jgi:hypothetical protein
MGSPGGLDPDLELPYALDIDSVACLARELAEVEHLGASVAFAKRMDIIDVAHDLAGFTRKTGGVERLQEVALHETAVDIRHAHFDIAAELELAAILGDFDGSDLAGPSHRLPETDGDGWPADVSDQTPGGNALAGLGCCDLSLMFRSREVRG